MLVKVFGGILGKVLLKNFTNNSNIKSIVGWNKANLGRKVRVCTDN